MKKFALAMAVLAAAPLAAAADVTKEDVKKLVAAGISEDVILSYIRNNGPVVKLSADDVVELKQAGASERVLAAMMGTAPAAPAARPDVVERVVEKPVYVPQTTYVYSTPSYVYPTYSSVWCYRHSCYDSCGGYYRPYYYSSSYCYPRYSYYYPSVGFSNYRSGYHRGWGYRVGVGWCY
jgi:hypothetical protein